MPLKQSKYLLGVLVQLVSASIIICCRTAIAQDTSTPGLWAKSKAAIVKIAEEGAWDVYLSGYAHHSRSTYTETRLGKLNEEAWGGGLGKTRRDERDNEESLYAMVIRDSNRNLQWSAGYAYQWIYAVPSIGVELGGGLTASLIRREDWFDGVPFPALLPVLSAGTRHVKLMGTYIPKMSTRKGKGNVLFLFAKVSF